MGERNLRRLLLALVGVAVLQLAVVEGPGRAAVQFVMNVGAALAVHAGVRRHRPARPLGWQALAAVMWFAAVSTVGWGLRLAGVDAAAAQVLESLPKLGILGSLLVTAVVFGRVPPRGRDRERLLDTATVVAAVTLLCYEYWRIGGGQDGSLAAVSQAAAVAFGLLMAGGISLGLRLVLVDRHRPVSQVALLTAGALAFCANAVLLLGPDTPALRWWEPVWVLVAGAVAIGALHPSMRSLTDPDVTPDARLSPGLLVSLCAALLINPALLVLASLRQGRGSVATAVGAGLLTLLVLWRIGRLVAERERARQALERGERRFRSLLRHAPDVVAVTDARGRLTYVSPAGSRLGLQAERCLGLDATTFVARADRLRVVQALRQLRRTPDALPVLDVRLAGSRRERWLEVKVSGHCDDPSIAGYVLNVREVTERKALEAQLLHQAFHDPLTGLPNRTLFAERVEHALSRRQREDTGIAVLFLDLDDFKTVNDSLGHGAGDELLRTVGRRLTACLRPGDTAARFGGDEFAVLLERVTAGEAERALEVAQRLLDALAQPLTLEGLTVTVSGSVGVAVAGPGTRADALLRDADLAMYAAKSQGKGRCATFDAGMAERARHRLARKAELAAALEREEFLLAYLPIVDLRSLQISGVEALLRWRHPQHGLLTPDAFLALAEETGVVRALGRWALEEACRAVAGWRDRLRFPALHLAIDVSTVQLEELRLTGDVRATLDAAGLPPGALVLELEERVLTGDGPALDTLRRLHRLGVRIGLDGFGRGGCSLVRLQHLPVDVLTVDRAFVADVAADGRRGRLARAVVDLAAALEAETVAEGVERPGQLAALRTLGCRRGRGPVFGPPLAAEQMEALLHRQRAAGRRADQPADATAV
jgi:diguanylate cyclase (GGDEF)-like protein/PAS domain S-box-containing protein